jgi:RNA polymerase sigma-70 factor (sigma-E family)
MNNNDHEFTEFMLTAWPRLVHAADLLTGDLARAEDLVQHALARAYVRWPKIRDGHPEAYVRRTMMNAYLDWWRRRRWRELPESMLDRDPACEDHAPHTDRRLAVQQALSVLTAKERAVIIQLFWYDLTEVQVSQELTIAVGTVKSTRARALRRLREHGVLMTSLEAAPVGTGENR